MRRASFRNFRSTSAERAPTGRFPSRFLPAPFRKFAPDRGGGWGGAGHSQVFGEMSPFSDAGIGVVTGPDEDTAHLVFRWFRPAVITGRVLDDRSEPVDNARVKLLHYGVADGRT